jgi:hypothetical protein
VLRYFKATPTTLNVMCRSFPGTLSAGGS